MEHTKRLSMRLGRVVAVLAVVLAVTAPLAMAFGFDDGVKPPRAIVGSPYSFAFKGRNGCPPYSFVFQTGSLPPGLSMGTDGVITGVPTITGRYSFWVELHDSGCRGGTCPPAGTSCSFPSQRPFTIDVVAPLAVAAPSPVAAENGVALRGTSFHATGGRAPYTWELTRAPDWVVLGTRGAIAGTPDKPGTVRLQVALTDQYDDRTTANASLIIKARLAITTTRLRAASVGHPYRTPLHTNGGVEPFHWNVTSGRFPVGIRLNTATGLLAGTPRTAGTYALTVAVKDRLGLRSSQRLILSVAALAHQPKPTLPSP